MTKRQWRSLFGVIATVVAIVVHRFFLNSLSDVFLPSSSIGSGREVDMEPYQATSSSTQISSVTTTITQTNALVMKAVDGDTLEALLDGQTKPVKIRLLGVNTPESVDPRRPVQCFGKEASRFAKELVEGQRILLTEDMQADDRDKYGRLLRNVTLEDGTDFNAFLIREGYAYAYVSFPLNKQRKNELSRLQEEAKAAKRGLWNPDTCDGMK